MHEEPLLIKMGLSRTIPRNALCMRKSVLGIRLHLTSAAIEVIKLKLCIENKRRMGNTGNFIELHEEYQEIEAGRKINLGEDSMKRH